MDEKAFLLLGNMCVYPFMNKYGKKELVTIALVEIIVSIFMHDIIFNFSALLLLIVLLLRKSKRIEMITFGGYFIHIFLVILYTAIHWSD